MVYYEDYRLKITQNEFGNYDVFDNKFAGRLTYKNKPKEFIDNYIQRVLSKRKKQK